MIGLALLAQAIIHTTTQPPLLGVEARQSDGRLFVSRVQNGSLAWDDKIRTSQEILTIDGRQVSANDTPETLRSAQVITTRSIDGTLNKTDVSIAGNVSEQRKLGFLAVSLAFIVVGAIVFILATDLLAATALFVLAVIVTIAMLVALATPFGTPWAIYLEGTALFFGPPSLLFFFLIFPINRLHQRSMQLVSLGSFIWAIALSALFALRNISDNQAFSPILTNGQLAELVIFPLGSMALILKALFSKSSIQAENRRALGIVALGLIAGMVPLSLLSIVPALLSFPHYLPADVAICSLIIFPISLGVAVLNRQFFGIRHIVQRGLIALVVWLILLALYTIALNVLFHDTVDSMILEVAIIAGTFPLIQHFARRWLERWLLPDVYDYANTLRQLASEIVVLNGLDTITQHVLSRVARTLDLQWTAIMLTSEAKQPLLYTWGPCPITVAEHPVINAEKNCAHTEDFYLPQIPGAYYVPLIAEGAPIGGFTIGPKRRDIALTAEDQELIITMAPFIATALRNALLVRTLEHQVEELQEREGTLAALSTRLMTIQEEERRQIALELHDDPLQRAILLARNIEDKTENRQAIEEVIASLRAICTDLHPPVLDDLGLVSGLERLVNNTRASSDLDVSFAVETEDGEPLGRLDSGLEVAFYRVAQEAVYNTLKHAQATQLTLVLTRLDHKISLSIIDNGCGYRPAASHQGATLHLGILGMRERLRPWNGTLTIHAPDNGGTMVSADVNLGGSYGRDQ
jgi:signal transduction histidine kinase